MLLHNVPILVVLVPLLGGVLTPLLFRRGTPAWAWASLVATAVFALCVTLLLQVQGVLPRWLGYPGYPVGSWKVPWGIELRVDALNAFVLLLVSAIGMVVTWGSRRFVAEEIPDDRQHFFYGVWTLCLTGLLGITITGDAFNVYVLLEVASLTSYILVGMGRGRDRRALKASIQYLIFGSIGASLILLGIGYLYMVTGTLNMADMAERLQDIRLRWAGGEMVYQRTIAVAVTFLVVGFGLKIAMFPLHAWLPDAYGHAPSAVSALLAGTATKVGAYAAMRFLFTVLGPDLSYRLIPTGVVLQTCAAAGVVYGSWCALKQRDVKRVLAYSSVAQIGYIALGIGIATPTALQGAVIHLFNHGITKAGLFLAIAAVALRTGGTTIDHLRGLGRQMPFTMAALVAGGLGLVGVPTTAGFISKWYLVRAAVEQGAMIPVVAVVVGSALALAYVWRLVEAIYFAPPAGDRLEAPVGAVLPAWILIGASVVFGVHSTLTSKLSLAAARVLTGGAP